MSGSRQYVSVLTLLTCLSSLANLAHAHGELPGSIDAGSPAAAHTCGSGHPGAPLGLADVVDLALCASPDTRSAWAVVAERAAGVGMGRAAYLPTLSATGQWLRDDNVSHVPEHADLSSDYSSSVHSESLSLEWVLYDSGGRHAALDSARRLLRAAQASKNAAILDVSTKAAKSYFAAQAARGRLLADEEIVAQAERGLAAATQRVERGIAPINEEYQTRVAAEQAIVTRNKDRGESLASLGTLADVMALPPDTSLTLEDMTAVMPEASASFHRSVSQLIADAMHDHPSILAAKESLAAARSEVGRLKASGWPTIKLVGQYSRNDQPVQLSRGFPHYPATGHDGYIGVQVNVPIFEGLSTTYQVRQAEAQVDERAIDLDKARQQVALQVWTSYQALEADTDNLDASRRLEEVATKSWESAVRRYQSGVGAVLELTSAQSSLAQAKQGRVEAIATWNYDKVALAAALGKLGSREVAGK